MNLKNYLIFFISIVINCFCISPGFATTFSAPTCSQTDIQALVDAAKDGDVITVPEGACTWTTLGTKIPSVYISNKNLTIQGAGINKTIITDATTNGWKETPFWVVGKPARITGFSFEGTTDDNGIIRVDGVFSGFRIDNCSFKNLQGRAIVIDEAFGVIDHCTLIRTDNNRSTNIVVSGRGDTSWSTPNSFGSPDAVFIEDCTFDFVNDQGALIGGYSGGRYVFRYNTAYNAQLDAHGSCTTGKKRSTFSVEAYNNTFISYENDPRGIHIRGGTGLFFNNTFTGFQNAIDLNYYRACYGVSHNLCFAPWDTRCTSYPCQDQSGRGTDQMLEPLYEWNNTINGKDAEFSVSSWSNCNDCGDGSTDCLDYLIQENREFYNDTPRPGYTPYTYPHPLVSSAGPSPPTNLKVITVE